MTAMIHDRSPGTGLAQHDPQAAATLLHLLDGSIGGVHLFCVVAALLPEAIACDALGNPDTASSVLDRALDPAERERMLVPFLIHPAPPFSERHAASARLCHRRVPAAAGQRLPELAAGGDLELGEDVAQVVLDGARG